MIERLGKGRVIATIAILGLMAAPSLAGEFDMSSAELFASADDGPSTGPSKWFTLRNVSAGAAWQDEGEEGGGLSDSGGVTQEDDTGTDPRGFAPKFMPYLRYTELGNDIEIQELVLFGMYAFSPKTAMTYEFPIYKNVDYGDFGLFEDLSNAFGRSPGNGLPSGGVPVDDLAADGDVSSIGDLNLRFFHKPDSWTGTWGDSEKSWTFMAVLETTLPTAQNDVIGGNDWIISPGITFVTDLPGGPPFGLGFIALMNFYDTNGWRDDGQGWTSRFRGRWFWMQPLTKPGPNPTDGLYVLTEVQPIYDFEENDFDLWIGPEFGKIFKPGVIGYVKPGWAVIDRESNDREFSLEIGFRIFF